MKYLAILALMFMAFVNTDSCAREPKRIASQEVEQSFEQELEALMKKLAAIEQRQRQFCQYLHVTKLRTEITGCEEILRPLIPKKDNLGNLIK
jgi:hypothetical protein